MEDGNPKQDITCNEDGTVTIKGNAAKNPSTVSAESPRPAQVDVEALRLPWRVVDYNLHIKSGSIYNVDDECVIGAEPYDYCDLIVTAVNSHASLINALKFYAGLADENVRSVAVDALKAAATNSDEPTLKEG